MTTNGDTSDGQDSVTCTTSTSNSEMSSVSNSFYKRWQLRSRSKSKDASSRHGRRSESPESSPGQSDNDGSERRGRRGLWELQKAASRVIGPESRVGRWVGKLRSRSSEARLGSLKSRYSDIRNWEGWKLEDDQSVEDRLVSPTLMVNDRPLSATLVEQKRPVYGKKILRSRSTEAINWTIHEENESRDFRRQVPVRESFEKAMRNKIQLSHNMSKPKIHSMYESEPNLAKENVYNVQSRRNEPRRYQDISENREHSHHHHHYHSQTIQRCTSQNLDIPLPRDGLDNNSRRQQRQRSRRNNRSSRSAERGHERPVSYHFEDTPRQNLYQKNQRMNQTSTLPRNLRNAPNGRRYQHSPDREARGQYEDVRYETIQFVSPGQRKQRKDDQQNIKQCNVQYDSQRNSRCHRERAYEEILEDKPVLARYIPPQVTSNEGYIKQCSLKSVPVARVSSTKSTPPNDLSTHVSASCTALHEIHTENNLKRFNSEQQLKRRSLTSLVSIESADSGASCSDGGRSSPNSDKESERSMNRKRPERSQSNISSHSSDSGYRSPTSHTNAKKDWQDLESIVLSSCFGENVKGSRKPVVNTSDYESESGYDDKCGAANVSRMKFQQTAMRLKSTEGLQESDEDHGDVKQQRNRRSPKKNKSNSK